MRNPQAGYGLLELPFFDGRHAPAVEEIVAWLGTEPDVDELQEDGDLGETQRRFARSLGQAKLLRFAVPAPDSERPPDARTICLTRDLLAYRSALVDFVFAMQGIGALPIWRFGSQELRERYLPGMRTGERIGALAITEPRGGSDVASTSTRAVRDRDDFIIDGVKTWISNGGVADQYVVIARSGEAPGARGLSAFVVDADNPGLHIDEKLVTMSPHALATVRLADCRVAASARLGGEGEGFRVAMSTLDVFRPSVGAMAVGLARRALDETIVHVGQRELFGRRMSDLEAVQMKIADMAIEIETATLMVYRAAWATDSGAQEITSEASMAKVVATEAAQRAIDSAVQLFGGQGVKRGSIVERLYRDVRPARIYEGPSEVQRLIVGRRLIAKQLAALT